jgi:hypothetical protein
MQKTITMSSRECEQTTRSGARGRATALSESTLCFEHFQTRDQQRITAQHPAGENKLCAPRGSVSPQASFESASEARKLLDTIEGELRRAELDPRPNAASYVREQRHKVAPDYRPRATALSTRDAWDPERDIKKFLTDIQNSMFRSDLDHVVWAAHDLARRRDPLSRKELEAWWISHRGGTCPDGDKPMELFLLFSSSDRARRMHSSAPRANGSRGNRRRRKVS